jgi:hypothetical protein
MEAQAAGMYIVTSPIAALNETCPSAAFIEGDWRSEQYAAEFVRETVNWLTIDERAGEGNARECIREDGKHFCLDSLAADWDAMLLQIHADVTEQVVPAFREAAE